MEIAEGGSLPQELDAVAESRENYWCDDPLGDCVARCPEPQQDGGSTQCSCERLDSGEDDEENDEENDEGQYWCTVTYYEPGEHPWETGGGGGGAGSDCGDARDGLAAEYNDDRIWGTWPCTKFSKADSDLIGVGASGYHAYHDGYGYISSALPNGIAKTEAHFNMTLEYTSAYRCPVRNEFVSESENPFRSHHIFGQAVDFYTLTSAWTDSLKYEIYIWGLDKRNAVESRNYSEADGNHNHLAWR